MHLWWRWETRRILTRAIPASRMIAQAILGICTPCLGLVIDVEDLEQTQEAILGSVYFFKEFRIHVNARLFVVVAHLVQHRCSH